MTITHNFRSGNSCDVNIPDQIQPGEFNYVGVEWENFPPSAEDIAEYQQEVYQRQVLPITEQAVRKANGPGRMIEVMPGVRVWIPNK